MFSPLLLATPAGKGVTPPGSNINFRTVVVMAARLTDRQKKKIVADYVQFGNYSAAARENNVSRNTVKAIVQNNHETAEKCQQKKEENTQEILSYMGEHAKDACEVVRLSLAELKKPERYEKTTLPQIATLMAIVIDKWTETFERQEKRPLEEGVQIIDDL